jgi:small-conductance mechanosensitive channel
MDRRRVVFKLGVTYQTPAEKIEQAVKIVEQIIIDHPDVTYDRGHFATFGAFSLDLEFVYFVLSNDYIQYMNIQQDVNFRVLREFEKLGIEFAYPTQTLFVNKEEKA